MITLFIFMTGYMLTWPKVYQWAYNDLCGTDYPDGLDRFMLCLVASFVSLFWPFILTVLIIRRPLTAFLEALEDRA